MAFADRSMDFEGLRSHFIEGGVGGYPLLMIHGSGPGASTMGNWRKILDPLAERFHIFAMDLIGFGDSSRQPTPPFFDLDMWERQCQALIDQMPGDKVGIVAHSISAVLGFRLASRNTRVAQLLTTGAMGAPFTVNDATIKCWTFPETRDALRQTAECLVYDASIIDDAYLDARVRILHEDPAYGPYFSSMFSGERQAYVERAVLPDAVLAKVKCAVTMLHGRNDIGFPPEITLAVASKLPQANVGLVAHCSHSIAMEHPEDVLAAIGLLFQ